MSEREDEESHESIAWADSCIISFPDDSDNNWETFKDAITEIIDIHPEIFVSSSSTETATSVLSRDEDMTEAESIYTPNLEQEADSRNSTSTSDSPSEVDSEIVSLLKFESDLYKNSLQDDFFSSESLAESGTTREAVDNLKTDLEEDGFGSNEESVSSQVFKDDFIDTYYVQDNVEGFNVTEDDLVKVSTTPQEIFKVWDLDTVENDDDEEDWLVLQLKKAHDESSTVKSLPQPLNDDQIVGGESNIDDLISGISDLSLTETFK
ncbi:unnamed protein product [Cochlearia groenlandica]